MKQQVAITGVQAVVITPVREHVLVLVANNAKAHVKVLVVLRAEKFAPNTISSKVFNRNRGCALEHILLVQNEPTISIENSYEEQ